MEHPAAGGGAPMRSRANRRTRPYLVCHRRRRLGRRAVWELSTWGVDSLGRGSAMMRSCVSSARTWRKVS